MLRIYADKAHYAEADRKALNDIPKMYWNSFSASERVARYGERYGYFAMVDDPAHADIHLLAMKWQHYVEKGVVPLALRALEQARAAGKPFAVFSGGDYPSNFPAAGNDIHVFENSGYRSRRRTRVHGIPAFFDDPVTGELVLRDHVTKPAIGFCGQAGSSVVRHAARAVRVQLRKAQWKLQHTKWEPTPFEHTWFRQRALDTFADSPLVTTRYVLRTKYRAGLGASASRNDSAEQSRREFVENVRGTDYTLSMRGGGNFSVRFYEALALGRTPAFIDTDCVLPFHDLIDWQHFVPWIDARDLAEAPEIVAAFHARMTNEAYHAHQRACRQLWVDRLSPDGFYRHFAEHFRVRR